MTDAVAIDRQPASPLMMRRLRPPPTKSQWPSTSTADGSPMPKPSMARLAASFWAADGLPQVAGQVRRGGGEEATGGRGVEGRGLHGRRRIGEDVALEVLAVAGVAAGAHARLGRLQSARIEGEGVAVQLDGDAGAL